MQGESDIFQNCVRAHLTTTASKPCTYYATMGIEKVFVKGPYHTLYAAEIPIRVAKFKRLLIPNIAVVTMRVMMLKVDTGFLNCQFGARTKWDKPEGYFLVCEDLLQPRIGEIPTKMASSKMWSVPVKVASFDAPNQHLFFEHVWYHKEDVYSIFKLSRFTKAAIEYVLHVLTSWVCGCGADLAMRNFLIVDDERTYQVDLEAWGKFDWVLGDTAPASRRTQSGRQMQEFVTREWGVLQPTLVAALENLNVNGDYFFKKEKIAASDISVLRVRLMQLQTLEGVTSALMSERCKKRPHS